MIDLYKIEGTRMANVLVTGSAGFIGSNTIQYLLENTDYVIYGIDNFQAGDKNKEFLKTL